MDRKNGLLAAAFAAIVVVAVIGWTRHANPEPSSNPAPADNRSLSSPPYGQVAAGNYAQPHESAATSYSEPAYAGNHQQLGYTQPNYASSSEPQPGYTQPPAYSGPAGTYVSLMPQPVVVRQPNPEPLYDQGPAPVASAPEPPPAAVAAPGRQYAARPEYVYRDDRHHRRSERKSAAIVAGSAGAGAAIGALAGGGKGAGIGALAGGTGGFIYDRLTHNH